MTVVEIWPGGGWFTEVLAPVLKGKGHACTKHSIPRTRRSTISATRKLLQGEGEEESRVFGELKYTRSDRRTSWPCAAGTCRHGGHFRNVHNWLEPRYKQDPAKLFGAFFTALKPGGILGIEDHRWRTPRPKTRMPRMAT
jgi:predicted methyltransferase